MYAATAAVQIDRQDRRENEQRLTLSAESMPLSEFAHWVSREAGISIVIDANLDNRPVTIDLVDEPVNSSLGAIARRVGVQVSRSGTLYYLGGLRPEDRGVLVRRVVRLDADQVRAAIETLLSDHGRVTVAADGLAMVGDRVEVLERVHELLDSVERAPLDAWVLQMYVMSITERDSSEFGLDVMPSFELAQRVGQASVDPIAASGLRAALTATLRASRGNEDVEMVASPLLIVGDGRRARLSDATVIPIPRRSVSDQGTVTVTGYDHVPVGLTVEVSIRDAADAGMVDLSLDMSQLGGMVDEAPIRLQRLIETTAPLVSGGVYLIGAWDVTDARRAWAGQLGTVREVEQRNTTVQAWAVVSRIAGPVLDEAPSDAGGAGPPEGTPPASDGNGQHDLVDEDDDERD
ncbi:MAG: hypothetical protein WD151_15165 [Phycisphaeraceae bacterium]